MGEEHQAPGTRCRHALGVARGDAPPGSLGREGGQPRSPRSVARRGAVSGRTANLLIQRTNALRRLPVMCSARAIS